MASTVTTSTVFIAKRNGQCQHCGHRFFSSEPNPAPLCYHCKAAGRTVEVFGGMTQIVSSASPSALYALASESTPEEVPDFDSYDDYAAFDADDLRDAAMERELDDCEVA